MTPTEPKAAPATHEPPEPTPEPGSLTTVDEGGATEGTEGTEATATETAEPTPEASPDEPTPGEEPAPALPPEVAEAIEIAKAQDGGKGKAEMLKRIHKLTDARDTERNARLTAEEQVKQMRQELQEARTKAPAAAAPAGMHPEVAKVVGELNTVDHWLGWCEEQLPRLTSGEVETVELPNGKGGTLQVGLKDVAKTRRDLENMRQEVVAKKVQTEAAVKAAFNEAYRTSHQAALSVYPWLKQETSREFQDFQTILKNVPGFKSIPDHELAIGDFLAGRALREAKAKGAAAPGPRKAAASREPTRVETAAPSSGAEAEEEPAKAVKQSQQSFAKSGSVKDLASMLTASRRVGRIVKR